MQVKRSTLEFLGLGEDSFMEQNPSLHVKGMDIILNFTLNKASSSRPCFIKFVLCFLICM